MVGRTLSHFDILEKLGEGGMGVVYKARDNQLNRLAAIKVLPPGKTLDPERRKRFIQEAQAASALNHPNIITIYEIFHAEGVDCIAMEFVAGKTLEQLIPRRGLPVLEVLKHAVQIADGLAKAHAAGIVHRDLKPGNVMVSDEGLVKVLDFGLAKLTEAQDDPESDATRTIRAETGEGAIVGTVSYMSPEQAQGKKVDARSDIFAFGALLYEMLTGQRAFRGDSKMSTLAAILTQEVKPPCEVSEGIPRDLEKIITRCLRKDATRRFQHMDDVKVALEELKEESQSGKLAAPVAAPMKRRGMAPMVIAGVAALVVGGAGTAWWTTKSSHPHLPYAPTQLTFDSGLDTDPALSPDGKLLAYATDRAGKGDLDIWIRQLPDGEPIALTHDPADDMEPTFSPDGSKIVFRSEREGGGLYAVSTLGGAERRISRQGHRPRFSPDGNWILCTQPSRGASHVGPVYVISSAGGQPKQLAPELKANGAMWTPDGKHVLLYGYDGSSYDYWIVPIDGGSKVKTDLIPVFRRHHMTQSTLRDWLPGTNQALFSLSLGGVNNLWGVPLSPDTWKVAGEPVQITVGAGGRESASASASGSMAFAGIALTSAIWSLPVEGNQGKVNGEMKALTHTGSLNISPALSGDGKKLVFSSNRSGHADIWMKDLATGTEVAITSTPSDKNLPKANQDGSEIVYNQAAIEVYSTSTKRGVTEKICDSCGALLDWSSDGQHLLLMSRAGTGVLNTVSKERGILLKHSKNSLAHASFSPDRRWVAFIMRQSSSATSIMVSALNGLSASPESEWITVSDLPAWHDKVEWAPNGNLLYFASDQDGFFCIWAQRLDPRTKKPVGPTIPIYHFHEARKSLTNLPLNQVELCVAPDKLIFNLGERTGNIWMTKLEK